MRKASEFIQEIQRQINRYGDLPVEMEDGTEAIIEFNDDEEPCFLIA